jgi:hypothetical protein
MKSLLKLIEQEFPKDRDKIYQRGQAEAIIWALFGGPILIIFIGNEWSSISRSARHSRKIIY